MSKPLAPPKRKNPLRKTRAPLSPQGVRSRTAHGLTAAAAEGRFALQVCGDCGAVVYPPRDACPSCLSARLPYQEHPRNVALILRLAEHYGIDRELALVEIADHVILDLGVLKTYGPLPHRGRRSQGPGNAGPRSAARNVHHPAASPGSSSWACRCSSSARWRPRP